MSILKMPELIESGKLILDNEKNYYSNNSSIKYAYIVSETKINGKNANIKITVRKSPQNNKFLVHHIYIEKGTERTSAGTSKSPKTAFIPFDASDSISQSPQNVNTKNDENSKNKKYAVDDTIQDEKSIEKYSDKEKENWQSSKNILIYRDNAQFEDFITKSLNNDINKIYIGKISSKLGEFIYSKTGLNISGYNLVLRSSEIRKILKYDHGDETKENLRGQRAIVKSDFLNFAKIITNPDEIYLGDKKYENKPVIIFVKTINGKTIAVTYVSAKHHDLTLQTMYSGKNKESLATTPSENKFLSQTSETLSGTASYKILAHEGNKVNIKENDNISDIKYATDDTLNGWLDDENTPQGIDYEKVVEKNPVVAVAKIYNICTLYKQNNSSLIKRAEYQTIEHLKNANKVIIKNKIECYII